MNIILKDVKYPVMNFSLTNNVVEPNGSINLQTKIHYETKLVRGNDNLKIFSLNVKVGSDETNNSPYNIEVVADGIYEVTDFDKDLFVNVAFDIMFVYVQSTISNMLKIAGFKPIYLPRPPVQKDNKNTLDGLVISGKD